MQFKTDFMTELISMFSIKTDLKLIISIRNKYFGVIMYFEATTFNKSKKYSGNMSIKK